MPVFLRYSSYKIFFWVNENNEPIHFHITSGSPCANCTKVWILSDGSFQIAHNKSRIPNSDLQRIFAVMRDMLSDYKNQWKLINGKISYYE